MDVDALPDPGEGLVAPQGMDGRLGCLRQTDHRPDGQAGLLAVGGAAAVGNALGQQFPAIPADRRPVAVDDGGAPVFMPELRLGGLAGAAGRGEEDGLALMFHIGAVEDESPGLRHQMEGIHAVQHEIESDLPGIPAVGQLHPVLPAAADDAVGDGLPGVAVELQILYGGVTVPADPGSGGFHHHRPPEGRQFRNDAETVNMGIRHFGYGKGLQPKLVVFHPFRRQIKQQLDPAKAIVFLHGLNRR